MIDRDTVAELPPSSKLVYLALREAGPNTLADITDRTTLPPRTVRYALDRLVEAGVVEQRPCLWDARQSLYEIVE